MCSICDFQEETSKLERHSEDLQKQNTLLHEQLQTMSSSMASSLKRATTEAPLNVSFTEEGKSQDQMLEILRYSRAFRPFHQVKHPIHRKGLHFPRPWFKCNSQWSHPFHHPHMSQVCAAGEGDFGVSLRGGPGRKPTPPPQGGAPGA